MRTMTRKQKRREMETSREEREVKFTPYHPSPRFIRNIERISLFASLLKRPTLSNPLQQRSLSEREEKEGGDDETIASGLKRKRVVFPFEETDEREGSRPTPSNNNSALHQLMREGEERKAIQRSRGAPHPSHSTSSSSTRRQEEKGEAEGDDDRWLQCGIVVKILNDRLCNGRYLKAKGVVEEVRGEGYIAEIRVLSLAPSSSRTVAAEAGRIRIDQEELETVIPKVSNFSIIL